MQISQKIAGFSLAEADNLRKAMGKKDAKKMESMAEIFRKGAKENQYEEKFSFQLFDNMAKFAEYGFNKSHSAAYALIAFQTAYLKAHYPVEYMCSVLSAESSTVESLTKYIQECQNLGIKVLHPDVNKSFIDFTTENENIRFGLSAIKNVGEKNIISIIEEREKNGEFTSILDLISRTSLNKKIIEGLCFGAALDSLDLNRATIIKNLDKFLSFSTALKNNAQTGMADLFGEQTTQEQSLRIEHITEFTQDEILKMEKENLGFYATSHPLNQYRDDIENLSSHSTLDLKAVKEIMGGDEQEEDMEIPNNAYMVGRVLNYQVKTTKNNDQMAIFSIEDLESELPMVIFPKTFKDYQSLLTTNEPLFFKVKVDFSKYELQGIVNYVSTLENARNNKNSQNDDEPLTYSKFSEVKRQQAKRDNYTQSSKMKIPTKEKEEIKPAAPNKLIITINLNLCSKDSITDIKDILEKFPGETDVYLNLIQENHNTKTIQLGSEFKALCIPAAIYEIRLLPFVKTAEYKS